MALVMAAVTVMMVSAAGQANLAEIQAATARIHRTEVAEAAGYSLVPGLDSCFESPGVGAMGYHYFAVSLLDAKVDALQSEVLVPGEPKQLC